MSKRWLGFLLLAVWIGGAGVARAAITPTPDPLAFDPVVTGQSATLPETLTASSDTTKVSVSVPATCPDFSVSPTTEFDVPHNSPQTVMVQFAPTSPGAKTCMIDIKINGTVRAGFTVSGTGLAPAIRVDQLPAFAATEVGKSSTAQLKLTNAGTSQLTIKGATLSPGSDFSVSGVPTAPVAVNAQVTLTITCAPSTFGLRTDTLAIASDAFGDTAHNVSLSCTGTEGVLALDQTTALDFGAVARGTTQARTFKLSNTGNLDVQNISLAVGPQGVSGYSLDVTTIATLSPGAGNAVTVTVSFKPMAKADGGPATITVTGSWGVTPTLTPALSLGATGTEASFGLDPAQPTLDFGKFRYDTHPQLTFQLLNDGNATLGMTTLFTADPGTKPAEYQIALTNGAVPVGPSPTLAADDHLTVVVSPQVQRRIGAVSGHIDITPSLGAPIRVPVTGVATAAEVEFPDTVSFGVVDLNQPPVMQTITIKNTGDGALEVMSITPSVPGGAPGSGAFDVVLPTLPAELAPGDSLPIQVTYQPTVATTGDSDAVLLDAALSGSLDGALTIKITGDAVFFQAHGSGGCDAGGAGRGGGLVIGLAALLVLRRRRRLARTLAIVIPGAVALVAPPAARADGIALSVFAPTPATAGEGFALQSPEIGAGGSWVANAVVSYASNPLVLDSLSGGSQVSSALVQRSTLMQVGFAYSLFGRLELGAHLPIYEQSGQASTGTEAMGIKPARGTATGNLAVHLKARLARVAGGAGSFALGASATGTLPTATRDQFTGADQPEGRFLVLAAVTPAALGARLTLSANAGPVIRKESELANVVQKSGAAWGGGLSVRILDQLWATAELYGEATPSGKRQQPRPGAMPPPATLSVIEGLAGVMIKPDRRVSFGLAVGRGMTDEIGTPDLRGVLTLSIVPGAAPLAPLHAPLPDGDADGDGIPDSVDKCPHEPEDMDGFQDADGCPDPDNDRDGIPDAADKCPNEPEDKDGFQDEDGCPDPDNDHDGIPDVADKCPNEPEDKDGFQDADGCPDPDNDHDGIPDAADKCPNAAETINGFQDDDGCPDKGDSTIILSPDKIETLDPIQFTGVKLARGATPLIEQVGATLRAHPEILRVRITVHVQPTGNRDADQARTEKRAQAVRDWLVQWGIAPARLDARGFGGTKPLVPPDQRGAVKLNERIEFIILERS